MVFQPGIYPVAGYAITTTARDAPPDTASIHEC